MPVFRYTAINQKGKTVKGSMDADSLRSARQRLRAQGIFPTDITEADEVSGKTSRDVKKYFQSNKVGLKDLSVATRQLATLVGAGLPLTGALQALSEQAPSFVLKRTIVDIREKVEEGTSLAKALALFPKTFPRLYINMVASGEASGTLDRVLDNLAEHLDAQLQLRRKIVSALFYPILMFGFCSLVVMALLTWVVPSIVEIFTKQGAVLPLPTRILIGISNILTTKWYLFIVAALVMLYLFRIYYAKPHGRSRIDRIILKLPLIGGLYVKVATARIARTLSTLLTSGVGLLAALEIVRNIVGNVHVQRSIEEAGEGVREGRSLAKELQRHGIMPGMLCHMIAVGEQSGELESMLLKASKAYENEVDATLSGLTSLIEPLMIILLGGIVFSIVVSILLPIMDLIKIVQR